MFFILFLFLNAFTFGLFWLDKSRARSGAWRIPERSFLLLALVGAWPALKIGQRYLRHKTRKQPFKRLLNLAALANIAILALILMLCFKA